MDGKQSLRTLSRIIIFLFLFVVRGVYDVYLSDKRATYQSRQNSNGLHDTASTVKDSKLSDMGAKDSILTLPLGGVADGERASTMHATYKQYVYFYLQKSLLQNRTQLLKTLYNEFVYSELRSADKRTQKERQHMLKNFPHRIQLLDRLWSILNHGRLPLSELHSPAVKEDSNHHHSLKDMLYEGSLIEIGNGATALKLATEFPKLTVMAIISSGQHIQSFLTSAYLNGVYNYYEGRLIAQDLISAVGQLYQDHTVLFSNLLLSDLVSLRGKLLPHELEEFMGKMLTLSSQTFVADIKTSSQREVQYFKHNWQSMSSLLQASCHMAGIKCKIDLISGDSGWNEGSGLYRVTVIIGVRYLPVALCHRLRPTAQWCQLNFNNYTDNVTVSFSDGSSKMTPASPIGISLHTLLQLGAVQENVDQVFKQLLHLPYKRLTPQQLLLTGAYLSVYTPGEDEVAADNEGNSRSLFMKMKELLWSPSMQWDSDVSQEDPFHNYQGRNEEPPAAQIMKDDLVVTSTSTPKTQVQHEDAAAVSLNKPSVQSQIDGVAQRWNRVDGQVPDDNKKEEEEVKKMGRQWDRENLGQHGGDPLEAQAQSKLKKLEKAWNREDVDNTEPNNHDEQGQVNGDTILRKDEKELKKAMGFLHGNSDVSHSHGHANLKRKRTFGDKSKLRFSPKRDVNIRSPKNPSKYRQSKINVEIDRQNKVIIQQKMLFSKKQNNQNYVQEMEQDKHVDEAEEKVKRKDTEGHKKNHNHLQYTSTHPTVKRQQQQPWQRPPALSQLHKLNGRHPAVRLAKFVRHGRSKLKTSDDQLPKPKKQRLKNVGRAQPQEADKNTMRKVLGERLPAQNDMKMGNYKDKLKELKEQLLADQSQGLLKGKVSNTKTNIEEVDAEDARSALKGHADLPFQKGHRLVFSDKSRMAEEQMARVLHTAGPPQTATGTKQDTAERVDGSEEEGDAEDSAQPHFGPADGDEDQYDMEWHTLKSHFYLAAKQKDGYFSLLTYGGKTQGLLGSKVAHLFSNASVVSILPYRHYKQSDKLRELTESLGLHNLLVFVTDLTPLKVTKLRAMPHITHFQVLGIDTWRSLSSFGAVFPVYLGQLLSLAQTTFLEIPKPEQLVLAYLMTHNTSQTHTQIKFQGLIHEALATAGLEADLEVLDTNQDDRGIDTVVKLLRVSLKYAERKVRLECRSTRGLLTLTSGGQVYVRQSGSHRQFPLARAGEAFGLDVLLELDPKMVPAVRAQLFEEYLHVKVHADMCPKNIVWFNSTLTYSDMVHSAAPLQAKQHATQRHTHSQSVLEILLAEFDATKPFSFLDYDSSNAHVLLSLAQRYPNNTFIAIIQEHAQANALYEAMTTKNITNIAVCKVQLQEAFVQKLRNSPDFLRYQYLSLQRWLDAAKSMSRVKFNFMMGEIIATGVTTFVQMPSAQMLSLAMVTFFPEAFHGRLRRRKDKETFMAHNHPWPLYDRAEFKLLAEAAHADVSIEVRGEVIQARQTSTDTWQPWSILRMDTTNLSLTVDHHFDYLKDGHSRKYQLHCISANKTHYEVYLIRSKDGFKIPYGSVYAFSLIALLRMGLLEPQRQRFYHFFVHLPYYEDMAPWNIVLRGGQLDYIDYDTKDVTLNKVVPAAFQVMAMLMNYERTVKDFGRCKQPAKLNYGLDMIGACVGNTFDGPCQDTRFPVPCADHTCRRTYLECLRALSDLELQKSHTRLKLKGQLQQGSFVPVEKPPSYFSGRWRFGPSGVETSPPPSLGHGQK